MGGSAFRQAVASGHPTLNTPRMTPAEYAHLKDIYLAKIRAYFSDPHVKVAVLKEAPEKLCYGDIDLFIGLDDQVDATDLANIVGATGLIIHSAGEAQKFTIGVLKDGTPPLSSMVLYRTIHTNDHSSTPSSPAEVTSEQYAQIDINVIPTNLVDWHIFYSAYGDLNGLLGHILTHLGFTVTDQGLWLRMKELDAAKMVERANIADHLGKVFLSKDPEQVMHFLGLSVKDWDAGFATLHELYAWLGACRMLHPVAIKLKRDRAHERKREEKRDVYRKFFFEWLPKRMSDMQTPYTKEEQGKKIISLRQKYLDEALDFFDKRAFYDHSHRSMVLTINNTIAANLLRPLIVKHSGAKAKKLGELVRAFRRFVEFDEDGQPRVSQTARTDLESQLHHFLDKDAAGLRDESAVDEFVRLNCVRLKELERQRGKIRAAEKDDEEAES